jgi:hypothetical protein
VPDVLNFQSPPPPSPCPYGTPNAFITHSFIDGQLRGRCSLASSMSRVHGTLFDPLRKWRLMTGSGCKTPTYKTIGNRISGLSTVACIYYGGDWS